MAKELEKEFLRKYADLCQEYNMMIVAEDYPWVGTVLANASDCTTEKSLNIFNSTMNYVQNGLVSPREYVIGKHVVFRDTGRRGLIIGAYWKFAEPYDYEATMEDDGSVIHFTDNDNFYFE